MNDEVLLRAYARRDTLVDNARLRAWLYRITRNVIVDHYRARRPQDPLPDDLAEAPPDTAVRATEELAACLVPLIRQLPAHYARALSLADLEDVPQAEVARRLGLSLSGAKSRIQRARGLLRQAMLACCRVEFDHRGRFTDFERHAAEGACACAGADSRSVDPPGAQR